MTTRLHLYFRVLLYYIFKFDKWHIAPLNFKPYVSDVILFLNQKNKKESVVEIGCGLGDMLRNLNFKNKIGFDISENVIRAASFLNIFYPEANFSKFDFLSDKLTGKHDVIILINWIHDIEPEYLRSKIEYYILHNLEIGGCVILDTLLESGYTFNHDINYLIRNINCDLITIGKFEHKRTVWAITKI
jgi:hypothetical protein